MRADSGWQTLFCGSIKNIFTEGELKREAVVANFATTAADGKTYQVDYYNLDVIISVGYRVKSQRGVQFRIWATGILKEYMHYISHVKFPPPHC